MEELDPKLFMNAKSLMSKLGIGYRKLMRHIENGMPHARRTSKECYTFYLPDVLDWLRKSRDERPARRVVASGETERKPRKKRQGEPDLSMIGAWGR